MAIWLHVLPISPLFSRYTCTSVGPTVTRGPCAHHLHTTIVGHAGLPPLHGRYQFNEALNQQ